jgi:hypothetical protein
MRQSRVHLVPKNATSPDGTGDNPSIGVPVHFTRPRSKIFAPLHRVCIPRLPSPTFSPNYLSRPNSQAIKDSPARPPYDAERAGAVENTAALFMLQAEGVYPPAHRVRDFAYPKANHPFHPHGLAIITPTSVSIFDYASSTLLFLTGTKSPASDLWFFTVPPIPQRTQSALFTLSSLPHARFVSYLHCCFGSPSLSTFLRALSRGYIHGIPLLIPTLVRKFPPLSLSTAFGHLNQLRKWHRVHKTVSLPIMSLCCSSLCVLRPEKQEKTKAQNARHPTDPSSLRLSQSPPLLLTSLSKATLLPSTGPTGRPPI